MLFDDFSGSPRHRGAAPGLTRRQFMIFGAGGVVAASAAAAVLARIGSGGPPAPPPSCCARAQTIKFIADVTDQFTRNECIALKTVFNARLATLAIGDALSFELLVPSEKGPLQPIFSGVKPDPGEHANALTHNRDMMRVVYETFVAKAGQAPAAVEAVKHGARTSPIVEALWVSAQQGPIDEIALWSDMVNSSSTVDHFKHFPKFGPAVTQKVALTGLARLKGARVTIYQLAVNTAHQTPQLRQWWDAYWSYVGAAEVKWVQVPA